MAKNYFNSEICGQDSWAKIYQSIEAWEPLINFILGKESLPASKVENLSPGTNAVFKSGEYVVKIFAPKESGYGDITVYQSELFALSFAQSNGVSVPKLFAHGIADDKYCFPYMIMDYIEGVEFSEHSEKENFTDTDKISFGKRMREITDKMNKPCKSFNSIDVKQRHNRWNEDGFSENFMSERLEYIKSHDFGEMIFIHGDLCADNILIDNKNNIYIIDFADAIKAPQCYEHAHIATELFNFDKSYLRGYFGGYTADELVDICFDGILLHDFGGYIINDYLARAENINCLNDVRDILHDKFR
jgi:serine/threonine protein kinase